MGFQYKNNNLFINGKAVVIAGGDGHAISQELCWVQLGTGRVVQPFVNTAKAEDLSHVCTGITLNGMPLAHQQSYCRISSGNETSMGGIKTNTITGRMFFTSGERSTTLDGYPAVCDGASVISNEGNCEPSTWVQPQPESGAHQLKTQSSPPEVLTHPTILSIKISGQGPLPHLFIARHLDTGHRTIAAFTSTCNALRAGLYSIAELVMTYSHDVIEIPYGVVRTRLQDDASPSLVLQGIHFNIAKNHYVYVFKDCMLWREFVSLGARGFCETRFEDQAGADKRVSLGCAEPGIGLPIQDDSGSHQFQYAASPIQWSWDYIHRMGGFHADDYRITLDHRVCISRDVQLCNQRLTEIKSTDQLITPDDPYTRLRKVIIYAIADMQRYWHYQDHRSETQALYKEAQADYAEKIISHIEACDSLGIWHDYDETHQAVRADLMAEISLVLSFSRRGQAYMIDALSNKLHILHQRNTAHCCLAAIPIRDSGV